LLRPYVVDGAELVVGTPATPVGETVKVANYLVFGGDSGHDKLLVRLLRDVEV
jgi:hypothetical protein